MQPEHHEKYSLPNLVLLPSLFDRFEFSFNCWSLIRFSADPFLRKVAYPTTEMYDAARQKFASPLHYEYRPTMFNRWQLVYMKNVWLSYSDRLFLRRSMCSRTLNLCRHIDSTYSMYWKAYLEFICFVKPYKSTENRHTS